MSDECLQDQSGFNYLRKTSDVTGSSMLLLYMYHVSDTCLSTTPRHLLTLALF